MSELINEAVQFVDDGYGTPEARSIIRRLIMENQQLSDELRMSQERSDYFLGAAR